MITELAEFKTVQCWVKEQTVSYQHVFAPRDSGRRSGSSTIPEWRWRATLHSPPEPVWLTLIPLTPLFLLVGARALTTTAVWWLATALVFGLAQMGSAGSLKNESSFNLSTQWPYLIIRQRLTYSYFFLAAKHSLLLDEGFFQFP